MFTVSRTISNWCVERYLPTTRKGLADLGPLERGLPDSISKQIGISRRKITNTARPQSLKQLPATRITKNVFRLQPPVPVRVSAACPRPRDYLADIFISGQYKRGQGERVVCGWAVQRSMCRRMLKPVCVALLCLQRLEQVAGSSLQQVSPINGFSSRAPV